MTKEEYRKKLMKDSTFSKFGKALIFLKIGQVKIIDKGEKSLNRFTYKHRFFNPYNPLSYFLLLLSIPVFIIVCFFKDVLPGIKDAFKFE